MNEITTITINGVTYTLRDSIAQQILEDMESLLDQINGEVV